MSFQVFIILPFSDNVRRCHHLITAQLCPVAKCASIAGRRRPLSASPRRIPRCLPSVPANKTVPGTMGYTMLHMISICRVTYCDMYIYIYTIYIYIYYRFIYIYMHIIAYYIYMCIFDLSNIDTI